MLQWITESGEDSYKELAICCPRVPKIGIHVAVQGHESGTVPGTVTKLCPGSGKTSMISLGQ
jgi:hypothetical protein